VIDDARRGDETMTTETCSERDGFGIARLVMQRGRKRWYSYDAGLTCRRTARKARAAAGVAEPWYWLDGVPFCAACVEGVSPCISDDEVQRASRSPASQQACRCHCCGEPAGA